MKKVCLFLLLILVVAVGTVFAQNLFVTEGEAYCFGILHGYSYGSFKNPFTDRTLASAWDRGYVDGLKALSNQPDFSRYVFRQEYESIFPNRIIQPRNAYEEKRQGITWSPIFSYKAKQYIFGPDGIYQCYEDTTFGIRVTSPIRLP